MLQINSIRFNYVRRVCEVIAEGYFEQKIRSRDSEEMNEMLSNVTITI